MDFHLLGSSSARPAHGREVSGSVITTPSGHIAVDCGEGFQSRLLSHGKILKSAGWADRIRHSRLDCILLTHGHLDHSWGLLPLLQSMSLDGRCRPLSIVGPTLPSVVNQLLENGIDAKIDEPLLSAVDLINQFRIMWSLNATSEGLGFPVSWYLVDPTQEDRWIKLEPENKVVELVSLPPKLLKNVSISPHETDHSVPSCAWMIAYDDRPGKFDRARADELDLDTDAISRLANGEDVIIGQQKILAKNMRGPPRIGASIIISGDTGADAPGLVKLAASGRTVDILVHESTYLDEHEEKARGWQHSTARDAAKMASLLRAKLLCLTHYSSRLESAEQSLIEAKSVFPQVLAGRDGMVVSLNDSGPIIVNQVEADSVVNLNHYLD